MKKFDDIPRVSICHEPTPIETLDRLSQTLGCNVLLKRDDCTGLAGGGNKTRKLEYLLADAQSKGADTLITIGGLQSNHARQTAAAAAKFGLSCELVLEDVANTPKEDYYDNGNMLLDKILGANVHQLEVGEDSEQYAMNLVNTLKRQGRVPYLVPIGGSNVVGGLGYVRCAIEIIKQIEEENLQVDQIILATGSAGTQAGLLAGLIYCGKDIPLLGINVSRSAEDQTALVTSLLKDILVYLELDPKLAEAKVKTNGDYYGAGYGVVTPQSISAIQQCASLEGVLLDPVYTGKGMAGLIDLCEKGNIAIDSHQLFIHTGGSQGLFGYREAF